MKFLANIPYLPLIFATLLLGLAPFSPEPHIIEKVKMLLAGALKRPIDIFDLLFHLVPSLLLLLKWLSQRKGSAAPP